jgi:hypothetical protein
VSDLVHGLADADGGSEVEDDVDVANRVTQAIDVADIGAYELDIIRQAVRATGGMDLRSEVVVDANGIAATKQRVDQVRTDEPGASGD